LFTILKSRSYEQIPQKLATAHAMHAQPLQNQFTPKAIAAKSKSYQKQRGIALGVFAWSLKLI
jgi:hypothetical protein